MAEEAFQAGRAHTDVRGHDGAFGSQLSRVMTQAELFFVAGRATTADAHAPLV